MVDGSRWERIEEIDWLLGQRVLRQQSHQALLSDGSLELGPHAVKVLELVRNVK